MNDNFETKLIRLSLKRLEERLDKLGSAISLISADEKVEEEPLPDREYIDAYDVANIFYTTVHTVYNWKYRKKIPYYKINGRLLFKKKEIEKIAKTAPFPLGSKSNQRKKTKKRD